MPTNYTLILALLILALAQNEKVIAQDTTTSTLIVKTKAGVIRMDTVRIKSGTFKMGMSREELVEAKKKFGLSSHDDDIEHSVELSEFYMAKFPVTKKQFQLFVEEMKFKTESETGQLAIGWNQKMKDFEESRDYGWRNPGFAQADDHPVVCVSWNDANAFCKWLSKKTDRNITLPTEAQWEYACRAGSKTLYYFGNDPEKLNLYGNVSDASLTAMVRMRLAIKGDDGYVFTSPVGRYKPNAFGLYDMHGNVRQWCQDCYRVDYEKLQRKDPVQKAEENGEIQNRCMVTRGSSWEAIPGMCLSKTRTSFRPSDSDPDKGFRIVITP